MCEGRPTASWAASFPGKVFDHASCPISEELVGSADISHLLMCETAAKACRHAGLDPLNLPLRNTGVFIGHVQGSDLLANHVYATCVGEAAQFLREVDELKDLPPEEQDAVVNELVRHVRANAPSGG